VRARAKWLGSPLPGSPCPPRGGNEPPSSAGGRTRSGSRSYAGYLVRVRVRVRVGVGVGVGVGVRVRVRVRVRARAWVRARVRVRARARRTP